MLRLARCRSRASAAAAAVVSSAPVHSRPILTSSAPAPLCKQPSTSPADVSITSLPNGIRVASLNSQGHFVTAGVYVDVGTNNESSDTSGSCNILDRMAFKSTRGLSASQLVKQLENMGGNILAHSSREGMMYQAAVFPHNLPTLMEIFGQIIREPLFTESELQETKESAKYELRDFMARPDALLPELLHSVAFQDAAKVGGIDKLPQSIVTTSSDEFIATNTIGNPALASLASLDTMTSDKLAEFHRRWYTPNRIVVAGVGMDHAKLEELAHQHFGGMAPATDEVKAYQQSHSLRPTYTGGTRIIDTSNDPPPANPDEVPMTRIHIAYESVSLSDPDVYALATLTSLMGGGGSFSAGGPGKGMYTRLYTQVLNQYRWVDACHMVNYTYNDTGLLGIHATVLPDAKVHEAAVHMLAEQLVGTTNRIQPSELSRAKNQLKSSLLMSLESRIVELEDIGRQVLSQNRRLSVQEMCRRIDMLEQEDLIRVARRVFFGEEVPSRLDFNDPLAHTWTRSGPAGPTVVVHGPLVGGHQDALLKIDETLSQWGIGRKPHSSEPQQQPASSPSRQQRGGRHSVKRQQLDTDQQQLQQDVFNNQQQEQQQAAGSRKWRWF